MATEAKIANLNWLKEHWFKASILAILLLFALPPAYYFLVALPQQAEQRELVNVIQSNMLGACLADADDAYDGNWANSCSHFGVSDKGPHCTLPDYNAEFVEQWHREAKQDCFKNYSNKGVVIYTNPHIE